MQVQIGLDEKDEEFEIYLDDEWFNATRLKEEGILNHISDVEYKRYRWCNPPTLPVPLLHLHPNFHVNVIISTITDLIDSFPYTWNPASNSPRNTVTVYKSLAPANFYYFQSSKKADKYAIPLRRNSVYCRIEKFLPFGMFSPRNLQPR